MVIYMNIFFISEYIKRITTDDINKFALNKGISLTKDELDIKDNYVKKEYKTVIHGNPKVILDELKTKVRPLTYNKIENLYEQFKGYLN